LPTFDEPFTDLVVLSHRRFLFGLLNTGYLWYFSHAFCALASFFLFSGTTSAVLRTRADYTAVIAGHDFLLGTDKLL